MRFILCFILIFTIAFGCENGSQSVLKQCFLIQKEIIKEKDNQIEALKDIIKMLSNNPDALKNACKNGNDLACELGK